MKITLIREERESGKEAVSTQETDMLMEKLKTENKTGYITELRSIIPHLKGTNARYEHIDRRHRGQREREEGPASKKKADM